LLTAAGIPTGQAGYLLGERHRFAVRLRAEEPADQQFQNDPAAADHGISYTPGVSAVDPAAALPASRATGTVGPGVYLEQHGCWLDLDSVDDHLRQMREDLPKIMFGAPAGLYTSDDRDWLGD
jgi:hypothetical protein